MFENASTRTSAVVLFFLSPLLAELMTGSAPPLEFFYPVGFFFIVSWYGCGVLLIREVSVRKSLNWKGTLILGMGFGILEEAIFVKTFFDPLATDLDIFGTFGRYFGVNIPWAAYLTLFHGLHSILFPILLTYILFPHNMKKLWLSRKGIAVCSGVLVVFSLIGWILFNPSQSTTPYIPDGFHLVGSVAVIILCILLSFKCSQSEPFYFEKMTRKERRKVLLTGIVVGFFFSLGVWIVASLFTNTLISVLYIVAVGTAILQIEKRMIQRNLPKFCYFIIGNLLFWSLLGFLQEFNGLVGMGLVGITFMGAFLVVVRWLDKRYCLNE